MRPYISGMVHIAEGVEQSRYRGNEPKAEIALVTGGFRGCRKAQSCSGDRTRLLKR